MADAELQLATGGPLGSKQMNLWCITASATAYTNLNDTVGANVPYDQIQIGALGNLDTNGELWVMLPDNDPAVVTLMFAESYHQVLYGVSGVKYTPRIKVNGSVTLDPDSVTNGADFCVGQSLQFDLTGLPNPIYDVTAIWTLPGTFVNTNSDPNCDLFYEVNTNLLRPPQGNSAIPTCWYVKDGQALTASVHVYFRRYPNGMLYDEIFTGKFNVHRPATAPSQPYQPDGTPTAQILNGTLSLGVSGVTNDMSFSHVINPGEFAGQAGYVQVITYADIVAGPTSSRTFTGNALDAALGEFPADRQSSVPPNTTTTLNKFYDAPSVGLPIAENQTTEDIFFSTYLMFKPSGGIWVPLRLITWELHDTATYNNGWGATTSTFNGQTQATGIKYDNDSIVFPDWTTTW